MRIFVTGGNGKIGRKMLERGCFHLNCDVTDVVDIDKSIQKSQPDVIIHLAGKADVNWCETNYKQASKVNYGGSCNMYLMSEKYNIPLVYLSSDHIFSGKWLGGYSEKSTDFKPVNKYGITKLSGEAAAMAFDNVKIVRTSTQFWDGAGAVGDMVDRLKRNEHVYSPVYMWRSFMNINHLCDNLVSYCAVSKYMPKILNLSGSKVVSWYTLTKSLARLHNKEHLVHPRFIENPYMNFVPRPLRVGLSTKLSKYLGFIQYDYMDGLKELDWQ